MTALAAVLVPLVVTGALVTSALTFVVTRQFGTALPVLLDLLLAAGLIRLSATASWAAIGSAAVVVILRRVLTLGLSQARTAAQPTSTRSSR